MCAVRSKRIQMHFYILFNDLAMENHFRKRKFVLRTTKDTKRTVKVIAFMKCTQKISVSRSSSIDFRASWTFSTSCSIASITISKNNQLSKSQNKNQNKQKYFTQITYLEKRKEYNHEPVTTARPRRLSEVSIKTTAKPLPREKAFFLISHTNR